MGIYVTTITINEGVRNPDGSIAKTETTGTAWVNNINYKSGAINPALGGESPTYDAILTTQDKRIADSTRVEVKGLRWQIIDAKPIYGVGNYGTPSHYEYYVRKIEK